MTLPTENVCPPGEDVGVDRCVGPDGAHALDEILLLTAVLHGDPPQLHHGPAGHFFETGNPVHRPGEIVGRKNDLAEIVGHGRHRFSQVLQLDWNPGDDSVAEPYLRVPFDRRQ